MFDVDENFSGKEIVNSLFDFVVYVAGVLVDCLSVKVNEFVAAQQNMGQIPPCNICTARVGRSKELPRNLDFISDGGS